DPGTHDRGDRQHHRTGAQSARRRSGHRGDAHLHDDARRPQVAGHDGHEPHARRVPRSCGDPAGIPLGDRFAWDARLAYVGVSTNRQNRVSPPILLGTGNRTAPPMSDDIPFDRSFDLAPETVEEVAPGLRRILADNPGPFTFKGTVTYIVGRGEVAVIDPGPDDPRHVDAILDAVR